MDTYFSSCEVRPSGLDSATVSGLACMSHPSTAQACYNEDCSLVGNHPKEKHSELEEKYSQLEQVNLKQLLSAVWDAVCSAPDWTSSSGKRPQIDC